MRTRQGEIVGKFGRYLDPVLLDALEKLVEASGDNWWKDLLRLWKPSGEPSGDAGLRLGIRNGYLNLYRKGQSVAQLRKSGDGPCIRIHRKYVFGDKAPTEGSHYCKLLGTEAHWRDLAAWIGRAEEKSDAEKREVDRFVGCNRAVIDLEMGLPRDGRIPRDEDEAAPRIDCVELEEAPDSRIRIVFWEAKLIGNKNLRAKGDPEVLEQIGKYRKYLDNNANSITSAYRIACALIEKLHAMASRVGNIERLDELVRRAAAGRAELVVDPQPRLLLFETAKSRKVSTWAEHRRKLESCGIQMEIFDHNDVSYSLEGRAPRPGAP